MGVGFEFERRGPDRLLARWVEAIWFARGRIEYEREWIAPTGACVAVLNLGDSIAHATRGARASRCEDREGWQALRGRVVPLERGSGGRSRTGPVRPGG